MLNSSGAQLILFRANLHIFETAGHLGGGEPIRATLVQVAILKGPLMMHELQ
jgi:hypothetical protein